MRWLATGDFVFRSPRTLDRSQATRILRELALIDDVERAQPDYLYAPAANDPYISQQWHLAPIGPNNAYAGYNGWNVQAGANVIAGWPISTGTGVVIGILDSGYTDHPDITPNLATPDTSTGKTGFDFVYGVADVNDTAAPGQDCDAHDPGNWSTSDPTHHPSFWHGTHVAGLAAAAYNNAQYGAGVAPAAKILPVRIAGELGLGYESDIAEGIVWASGATTYPGTGAGDPPLPTTWTCGGTTHNLPFPHGFTPARVINISYASAHACAGTVIQTAINTAYAAGTVVVVAAGNFNANVSGVSPASCSHVITVAATDFGGQRARQLNSSGVNTPYSDYGAGVTVSAPGGGYGAFIDPGNPTIYTDVPIMSDWNTGTRGPLAPSWKGADGTSMSSPLVAGLAAAMVAKKPTLTPDLVKSKIAAYAKPWGTAGLPVAQPNFPMGSGLMDSAATLTAVAAMANPAAATIEATPNDITLAAGQTVGYSTWSWDAPGYDVVDIYVSTDDGDYVYNGVWPAHYHGPTPSEIAKGSSITWKMTPHGDTLHVLGTARVSAHL
jgi:serine protease